MKREALRFDGGCAFVDSRSDVHFEARGARSSRHRQPVEQKREVFVHYV
jgi:hypothetical protein